MACAEPQGRTVSGRVVVRISIRDLPTVELDGIEAMKLSAMMQKELDLVCARMAVSFERALDGAHVNRIRQFVALLHTNADFLDAETEALCNAVGVSAPSTSSGTSSDT